MEPLMSRAFIKKMTKEKFKVQCISNNCGIYESIKIGKWYDAEYYNDNSYLIYTSDEEKVNNPFQPDVNRYDKSLFRTLEEKRDQKLNKLFK